MKNFQKIIRQNQKDKDIFLTRIVITKDDVEIFNHELLKIEPKINVANWSAAEYEKDGFVL